MSAARKRRRPDDRLLSLHAGGDEAPLAGKTFARRRAVVWVVRSGGVFTLSFTLPFLSLFFCEKRTSPNAHRRSYHPRTVAGLHRENCDLNRPASARFLTVFFSRPSVKKATGDKNSDLPEVGEPFDELGSVVLVEVHVGEERLEDRRARVAAPEEHQLRFAQMHRGEGGRLVHGAVRARAIGRLGLPVDALGVARMLVVAGQKRRVQQRRRRRRGKIQLVGRALAPLRRSGGGSGGGGREVSGIIRKQARVVEQRRRRAGRLAGSGGRRVVARRLLTLLLAV